MYRRMKRLLLTSVMLALVLTACETTRQNAPKTGPMTRCTTITQCERVTND
jgi:hypothetical protein